MTAADWVAAVILLAITAAMLVVATARLRRKGVEPLTAWDMQHSHLLEPNDEDGTP